MSDFETSCKKTLDIELLGKQYQVNCPSECEENLYQSADYLDAKMRELKKANPTLSNERIVATVALNISYELVMLKEGKNGNLSEILNRLQSLCDKITISLPSD